MKHDSHRRLDCRLRELKAGEEVDPITLWKRWSEADARSSVDPHQRHGNVGVLRIPTLKPRSRKRR